MTQIDKELIVAIRHSLNVDLPEMITIELLEEKLAAQINDLIQSDFQQLLTILYRVDVNEAKLRQLLKEYPGADAGKIIAGLVIERQLQKIKTRREFNRRNENISDEEKW
jgi:hypothetical protein